MLAEARCEAVLVASLLEPALLLGARVDGSIFPSSEEAFALDVGAATPAPSSQVSTSTGVGSAKSRNSFRTFSVVVLFVPAFRERTGKLMSNMS